MFRKTAAAASECSEAHIISMFRKTAEMLHHELQKNFPGLPHNSTLHMQRLTHADDVGLTALTPSLHSPLPHNSTSHMQRLTHADDVGLTALTPSLH